MLGADEQTINDKVLQKIMQKMNSDSAVGQIAKDQGFFNEQGTLKEI